MSDPESRRGLTWEEIRDSISELALSRGVWEGYPMPVEGAAMRLHARHPMRETLAGRFMERPRVDEVVAPDERLKVRNHWESLRERATVWIVENARGRAELRLSPWTNFASAAMLTSLSVAGYAWDVEQECRAMEKLMGMITSRAATCYVTTGAFLETSERSGVTYLFRRLRPTIALRPDPKTGTMMILTTLCLHPIGFYSESWAGAMVPTDDVIAHVLMARGDEHRFWRYAEQHPAWSPFAGI